MHLFDYSTLPPELETPEIQALVCSVREIRKNQSSLTSSEPAVLRYMIFNTLIRGALAASRYAGMEVSAQRMPVLLSGKAKPRNKAERIAAGYALVLATVGENYACLPPNIPVIRRLHKDLCRFLPDFEGGDFRMTDYPADVNPPKEGSPDLLLPKPEEIPVMMEQLTTAFLNSFTCGQIDPLLAIPMFALDFYCIRPFPGGNIQMCRILVVLMLYWTGHTVGRYVSIGDIMEENTGEQASALLASVEGWNENRNNPLPYVRFFLETMQKAYAAFASGAAQPRRRVTRPDRVRRLLADKDVLSRAEIFKECSDIPSQELCMLLSYMHKKGELEKVSGADGTCYVLRQTPGVTAKAQDAEEECAAIAAL